MSLAELMPAVRSLPLAEKVELFRFLADEVDPDEALLASLRGKCIPVWTPFNAYEAAEALEGMLRRKTAAS